MTRGRSRRLKNHPTIENTQIHDDQRTGPKGRLFEHGAAPAVKPTSKAATLISSTQLQVCEQESMAATLNSASNDEKLMIAPIIFKPGEVVWAKIKGFAHWPAKIKSFPSGKMVIVVWFNDYTQ